MGRVTKDVKTEYGPAKVQVTVCDTCEITVTATDSYVIEDGWVQTRQTVEKKREELEFCSVGCMVARFAPGYFDVDPAAVTQALQGLKKIEVDLGRSKTTPIPY